MGFRPIPLLGIHLKRKITNQISQDDTKKIFEQLSTIKKSKFAPETEKDMMDSWLTSFLLEKGIRVN